MRLNDLLKKCSAPDYTLVSIFHMRFKDSYYYLTYVNNHWIACGFSGHYVDYRPINDAKEYFIIKLLHYGVFYDNT